MEFLPIDSKHFLKKQNFASTIEKLIWLKYSWNGLESRCCPSQAPIIYQEIIPDFTIEITDKIKVLDQLDMMGINLKTIYGDIDDVAKHLKEKYYD